MPPSRKSSPKSDTPIRSQRSPAKTPEGVENRMISMAVDLAEKQMREGTASSQVITHYLKLGTTTHQLEKQKLENENELLKARVEALASTQRMEELYEEAISAMRDYSGKGTTADDHD